jgi:hypothetical protein
MLGSINWLRVDGAIHPARRRSQIYAKTHKLEQGNRLELEQGNRLASE